MNIEDLKAYKILEKREIRDLNSVSWRIQHVKTGAKIALLQNDDPNKVFYIGFRTPPKDSTGVAHIIEHSVLEGSDEFPVKDPFIELAKGTLNTFLNAMTYPDKTVYPVASCNDKDFQNLMHVYLDAVFHPFIYREKNIFLQEGWHYEMNDVNDPLTINGVVYNEMKGAYSSADDVLEREIINSLYPDTPYGFESGGDPENIPDLKYEDFLKFHQKYYHPSNSYIYLYGNMDMAEKLDFIDKNYLSFYDYREVDSRIVSQKAFEKTNFVDRKYPIGQDETEKDNTYLSLNFSVGDSLDRELYIAFQVLDYALCSAPGAPLKEKLIHKNIGKDVYSNFENGIKQPYFSIVSKGANFEQKDDFLDTVDCELKRIVSEGIDKKALTAGLNYYEFKYREADFESTPKGLIYGLQMLDSWLYDDASPFIHVEALQTFAALRDKISTDYYEKLIKRMLLDNKHRSVVCLIPEKGLTERNDRKLEKKLSKIKESLTMSEISQIIAQSENLKAWQEKPDDPENLRKIPLLKIEDIGKTPTYFVNELHEENGTKVLFHPNFTNGIAYVRLIFDLDSLSEEDLIYAGLMKCLIGMLNTKQFTYGELFNEINIKTGGISVVNNVYTDVKNSDRFHVTMEIKGKVLIDSVKGLFDLFREMLLTSDWSDKQRIGEIISENRSRLQAQMISAGHVVAANRAMSYFSKTAAVNERFSGITFYKKLEEWEADFENLSDSIISAVTSLATRIFRPENLMVDYIADDVSYDLIVPYIDELKKALYRDSVEKSGLDIVTEKANEGFKSASQVQFVASAGNFSKKGVAYTGALKVLKVIMGYDYLWNQVRVKGGAYGCMCNFSMAGDCYFVSYRDPNLSETLEVFKKACDYIEHFKGDRRTMTQFIIGAISELDMPKNPAALGLYSLVGYMSGITNEMLDKQRSEILNCDENAIRNCAEILRDIVSDHCICVVGNAEKIEQEKEIFSNIQALYEGKEQL